MLKLIQQDFYPTIPDYNSSTGWNVVANPDGIIESTIIISVSLL